MALLFPRLAFADDREALRIGQDSLRYRELAHLAAAHVEALAAAGVRAGDRVGVTTEGAVGTAVAMVGNALAGVVTVPLNPKLGPRERAHVVGDAAPCCIFSVAPERVQVEGIPVRVVVQSPSPRLPPARAVDGAPMLLLYTSGTTGAPKGATITSSGVAANIDALASVWGWTDLDMVVHALPLFHVHGLVLGLFGSLRVGGALHHLPRFEPAEIAASLEGEGTMLFAVPTMYHRLADAASSAPPVARGLASARLLVSGSAALPLREHRRLSELIGRGVHERYGLTETLIDCAVPARCPPRPGYVGPPLPGVELRLVDDARAPLDVWDDATLGEVAVRGPSVFAGYWGRPEATAAVRDAEGWFYTGDLATRAADGAVRIVGRRATDLIKTGGFKVGAGEVEACLLEHPDVREAAVVGAPDPDLGERIVAFVVASDPGAPPSADALSRWVAEQLTPHKRPRAVHVVDALPRNPMGKVQKPLLRARCDG